ncbi:MAG TPA: serine/threonine-protein kinase [Tepidisphaeraceae bacterium]|jgi:serine/threonine-protein kinase|nr:serine/threonine-protein kinase [Tepidisphaeraceae bacterium]
MGQKLLHYDVIERLGEGARSVIYAVSDPVTKQLYALKHVVRADPKDLRFVEQMEAEYEISRQFTHPNLRRTYDLKINKAMLVKVTEAFLLMELVDGKALDVRPPKTMLETIDTFVQVAQGLQAMHTLGFVHCDIKPNNILRSDTGKVKIIDFGQSCKIGTIKERIQGTPDYIAPEQVKRKPVSHKTDIFNLGATMYWALTGKNIPTLYTVNQGDNSFLVDDRIDTVQDLNTSVPPALSNLIMECVSSKPEKRPAGMDHVINRLELSRHILTKPQTPAAAPPPPRPPGQPRMEQLPDDEMHKLEGNS